MMNMNESAYYSNAPEIRDIALKAFPDYNGRSFKVETFGGPMRLDSYWEGGSRDYYAIVNMNTGKVKQVPENGTPWSGKPWRISKLPPNFAVVRSHRGRFQEITIYVNPENISKMLPAPEELPWAEKVVLAATRSFKSSYMGRDRRDMANREMENIFAKDLGSTHISKQEWDAAKQSLIQKGMLNKAGAITDKGRNAIGDTQVRHLRKETQKAIDNPPETGSIPSTL